MARPATLLLLALAASQVSADLVFPDHLKFAVVAKAAADDPGYEACVTAEYQVTECLAALPTTAPTVVEAQCFCCEEDVNVASVFGGCETYIVASAPAYTDEYSVMSIASSFCQSVSLEGFTCSNGASAVASTGVVSTSTGIPFTSASAGGATRTVVPTASSTAAATFGSSSTPIDSAPPACTSVESVFESCSSSVKGFATMDDVQAASCICYTHGKYTTAFDNYIADCVPWIKTAEPTDYADFYALEGFCGTYKPKSATASSTPVVDSSSPSASSSAPATTKAATTSHTSASTSTLTPTTTAGNALTLTTGGRTVTLTPEATVTGSTASSPGAHNMASRLFAWLAAVIPLAIL